MKMTIDEFKMFAQRCVSEDGTRWALQQPWRNGCHAYVSDGRIALILENCGNSLKADDETGARNATIHLNDYILRFTSAIERGSCEEIKIDVDHLHRAVTAALKDLEPSMDYLRHYEPDPDDLDDVATTETVRFVQERFSYVILPDHRRTVIAGYYAAIMADILALTDTRRIYTFKKDKNSPIFVTGDNWWLILMPLRATHEYGEPHWMTAGAIADAATGELLHGYNIDEPDRADLDALRFPKKGEVAG